MSLKLREFIKKIRLCKTADEERSLVNKESAEIRNLSKEQGEHYRMRSLSKCICVHLLGFPTEFIQMTCLSLLASTKFTEKRLAYLGVCILFDEKSEVLLLTSHTIKKDLDHPNQFIVSAALNAIGEIATPDMCRDTSGEVLRCLNSTNPFIKKKACLALCKITKKCPELIDTVAEKLKVIFEDKNHGVLLCGLALVVQLFKADSDIIKKYIKYSHHIVKFLKNLSTNNHSQEYDINGIADPFLQVKILEVLGLFGTVIKEENDEICDLFGSLCNSIDSEHKNTGKAVLYELVRSIFMINSSSGLKTLGSTILGKFLEHKDNNYKYIALNSLQEISKTDLSIVQKHKNIILESLKDNDISIKRSSLDLIYLIVNQSNIKQIVIECLNFLNTRENNEFVDELINKIFEILERFSPSLKYEIDTLLQMLCLAEGQVSDSITSKIINVIIAATELHQYSMFRFFIAMKSNLEHEGLIKVGVYLLGEFGHLIVDSSALVEEDESVTIKEEDIIELLAEIKEKKINERQREALINCYFKLVGKLSENSQEKLKEFLLDNTRSFYCEVQERSTEYLVFLNHCDNELKQRITDNIPTIKMVSEDNCAKQAIVKEFEDEDSKNLYQGLINGKDANDKSLLIKEAVPTTQQNNIPQGSLGIFDDITSIFQSGTPMNNNPLPSTNATGFNMMDFTMPSFPMADTNTNTNNPSGVPMNLFDNIIQPVSSSSIQQHSIQKPDFNHQIPNPSPSSPFDQGAMKEVYKSTDITIYSMLQSDPLSPNAYNGSFFISNNQIKPLQNVKLNFSVKKTATLKVISTSSSQLDPNASLGIKKEVTIQNNDPSKPIVYKLSISYTIDSKEVTDTLVVTI